MPEYAYLWEFQVAADHQAEFERHYGADGTWVALFRQHPGFLGTSLLQDRGDPQRYVTIDRWRSKEAFRDFRAQFASQYEALDEKCAGLTIKESSLGQLD
jgi:heme-degrading monooxygenase HmoA